MKTKLRRTFGEIGRNWSMLLEPSFRSVGTRLPLRPAIIRLSVRKEPSRVRRRVSAYLATPRSCNGVSGGAIALLPSASESGAVLHLRSAATQGKRDSRREINENRKYLFGLNKYYLPQIYFIWAE